MIVMIYLSFKVNYKRSFCLVVYLPFVLIVFSVFYLMLLWL